jgi:prenylcysteine alpha-carboxyl methylesterase
VTLLHAHAYTHVYVCFEESCWYMKPYDPPVNTLLASQKRAAGAWTIGYKAWGCALGRRLSQRGLLVFCLDYRNFPQGLVMDMLEDVNRGINWVFHNCHLYGGDADNIFLVGQSAGGHLTSLVLLAQAMRQAREHRTHVQVKDRDSVVAGEGSGAGDAVNISQTVGLAAAPNWDPRRIRGFVGVSGAYNLVSLTGHLHKRGLYQSMFEAMMSGPEGTPMMKELSPALVASTLPPHVAEIVPKMLLLHGTGDKSVPIQNAEEFCAALRAAGVRCVLKTYLNKTHTQPIIEDPMRGGRDELMDEVLGLVRGKPCYNKQFPMQPSILIDAATWICPF